MPTLGELREAVAAAREAVAATVPGDPFRPLLQGGLAAALRQEFELIREAAGLIEAAQLWREAIEAEPDPDGLRLHRAALAESLSHLAVDAQGSGPEGAAAARDLADEAVAVGRLAVDDLDGDDPDAAWYLANYSATLRLLFEYTGDQAQLSETVGIQRRAVAAAEGGPYFDGCLDDLIGDLQSLYLHTGDIEVLREAARLIRRAIEPEPETGADAESDADTGRSRAGRLARYLITFVRLYERTGAEYLITEAVALGRAAVAAERLHGSDEPGAASGNLAIALHGLSEHTGDLTALREAVRLGRDALAAVAPGHPDRAECLSLLAVLLRRLALRTGEPEPLAEAAQLCRAAIAAASEHDPGYGRHLSNLGAALLAQYEQTRDPDLLGEAVEAGRKALARADGQHVESTTKALALGRALSASFETTRDARELAQARDLFAQVADTPSADSVTRIVAGRELARVATTQGDHAAAFGAIRRVAQLLPSAVGRDLERRDRERRLAQLTGTAGRAAAAALSAGRPESAVELLEQTRGLLLAEAMGTRAGTQTLRRAAPDLLAAFEAALRELAQTDELAAGLSGSEFRHGPADREQERTRALARLGERRRDDATRWEALLQRIRARAGLADFLAAAPISRLRAHAESGPVILLTCDSERCDALILLDDEASPVKHVALPGLSHASVTDQAYRLAAARALALDEAANLADWRKAQRDIHDVLAWLWDAVAEPVLDALGHRETPGPDRPWPHVWWCPGGPFTHLPLHAAGHHDEVTTVAHPRTVLDRVVSSYTATVGALAYARRPAPTSAPASSPASGSVLLVAVPEAPGAEELTGVAAELDTLSEFVTHVQVLHGPSATFANVVAALKNHSVAHFACHGRSDLTDPQESSLLLADSDEQPFTLLALSNLHLEQGSLAFLSACGTSEITPRLRDEALHITSGFQLAGFRHVIGTLWPVNDRSCAGIARSVYAKLTADGTQPVDPDQTVGAIHEAVRQLRAQTPGFPTDWAPYVHVGA